MRQVPALSCGLRTGGRRRVRGPSVADRSGAAARNWPWGEAQRSNPKVLGEGEDGINRGDGQVGRLRRETGASLQPGASSNCPGQRRRSGSAASRGTPSVIRRHCGRGQELFVLRSQVLEKVGSECSAIDLRVTGAQIGATSSGSRSTPSRSRPLGDNFSPRNDPHHAGRMPSATRTAARLRPPSGTAVALAIRMAPPPVW
jgi:hypothetical protein